MGEVVNFEKWKRGEPQISCVRPEYQKVEATIYLDDVPIFSISVCVPQADDYEHVNDAIAEAVLDELDWQWGQADD